MDDILLKASSPEIYRINAFRLVELPVDATVQQVKRREQEYTTLNTMGLTPQEIESKMGGIVPLIPPPSKDIVYQAFARLRDPELRLVDELFWFWPLDHNTSIDEDDALSLIKKGDFQSGIEVWSKHEKEGTESMVSTHNLAVLYHMLALDIESKGLIENLNEKQFEQKQVYWKDAAVRWKNCIEQEGLWKRLTKRVLDFKDPRLTGEVVQRFRTTLPLSLLLISASLAMKAAESGKLLDAKRHVQFMTYFGFDSEIIEKVLNIVIAPIRERIKLAYAYLKKESQDSAGNFKAVASSSVQQISQMLKLIETLLPSGSMVRIAINDEAATKLMETIIGYCNKTSDWRTSKQLLDIIICWEISEAVKQKIKNNLDIIVTNIEIGTCWFCKKNPPSKDGDISIKMYGNVKRTPDYFTGKVLVEWQYNTFTVPRCSSCKKAHKSIIGSIWLGILSGAAIGVIIIILARNLSDFSSGAATFFIFTIFATMGGILGNVIAKKKKLKGVLPESKKSEFPLIKKKLNEGWVFGDKPATQ